MKRSISVILLVLFLVSCMPLEETSENSTNPNSEIITILNGHANETVEENKFVTPCCLTYRRYGLIIESEIIRDLSNSVFSDVNSLRADVNQQYLIINLRFINASLQPIELSDSFLAVEADGTTCEYIGNSYNSKSAILAANRETDLSCCYIIPKKYSNLTIVHKKYIDLDSIEICVQDNGEFNETDLLYIVDNYSLLDEDYENEYVIPINYAESDSFYHSEINEIDYAIDNTFDGDYSTCWQDGSDAEGINESLYYYFDSCQVYEIRVVNGNRKQNDSYKNNNRLENAMLSFYLDGVIVHEEEMFFSDDELIEETTLLLESPVFCDSISVKILSVYRGNKYDDTGISEVSFVSHRFTPIGLIVYSTFPALDNQKTDTESTTADFHSKSNPRDIVGEDVPDLKPGEWIRVTGKADCYVTDDGRISIKGFETLGKYGLLIYVKSSDGKKDYILEAPYISDAYCEEHFSDHVPDISYGYRIPFNCKVTVVGKVGTYSAMVDGTPYSYICLSINSEITDLEFYD